MARICVLRFCAFSLFIMSVSVSFGAPFMMSSECRVTRLPTKIGRSSVSSGLCWGWGSSMVSSVVSSKLKWSTALTGMSGVSRLFIQLSNSSSWVQS